MRKRPVYFLFVLALLGNSFRPAPRNELTGKSELKNNNDSITVEMKFIDFKHDKPPMGEIHVALSVQSHSRDTLWLLLPYALDDASPGNGMDSISAIETEQVAAGQTAYALYSFHTNLAFSLLPIAPGASLRIPGWRFFISNLNNKLDKPAIRCYHTAHLNGEPFTALLRKKNVPSGASETFPAGDALPVLLNTYKPAERLDLVLDQPEGEFLIPVKARKN